MKRLEKSANRKQRDHRRALGAAGEARAARYLEDRGYRILERNVRYEGVELDLIVARSRLVAFVEVKTRRCDRFGAPELAVDFAKQARLVRAAVGWLREHPRRAHTIRFDVVSCRVRGHEPHAEWEITHLPGAFEAGT